MAGDTASLFPLTLERETTPGNYFVSNYPPYSFWKPEYAAEAYRALERTPPSDTPLGIYLHIPFCRKRCHFCYFRVYTNRNAQEVEHYLDLLAREWALYGARQAVGI